MEIGISLNISEISFHRVGGLVNKRSFGSGRVNVQQNTFNIFATFWNFGILSSTTCFLAKLRNMSRTDHICERMAQEWSL